MYFVFVKKNIHGVSLAKRFSVTEMARNVVLFIKKPEGKMDVKGKIMKHGNVVSV